MAEIAYEITLFPENEDGGLNMVLTISATTFYYHRDDDIDITGYELYDWEIDFVKSRAHNKYPVWRECSKKVADWIYNRLSESDINNINELLLEELNS